MRRIKLETLPIEPPNIREARLRGAAVPAIPFKFAEGIVQILETKPDGMSLSEMRQCIRVQDAAEKAGDTLAIEDADWAYLSHRLAQHRFPFASSAFLALEDAITHAETIDPT